MRTEILVVSANKETNLGDILIFESLFLHLTELGYKVDSLNYRLQYYDIKESKNQEFKNGTPKHALKTALKKFPFIYFICQLLFFFMRIPSYAIRFKEKYKDRLVIIGGGQLIMDTPLNILTPFNLLFHVAMGRLLGKGIILLGIGVSEHFYHSTSKILINLAFSLCNKIICRDILSFERALCYARNPNVVTWSSDLSLLYRYPKRNKSCNIKNTVYGISTLAYYDERYFPLHDHQIFKEYKNALTKTIEHLELEGNKVVLVPTTYQDAIVANEISPEKTILPKNVEDLVSNMSHSDYFICTRMHSFLIALNLNIPSICFKWDSKISGIAMSFYGFSADQLLFDFKSLREPQKIQNLFNCIDYDKIFIMIENEKGKLEKTLNEAITIFSRPSACFNPCDVLH